MSHSQRHDDVPPEIVAAIMAALAAVSGAADDDDEPCLNWSTSTRVVPRWHATGPPCWRDVERARGWRQG